MRRSIIIGACLGAILAFALLTSTNSTSQAAPAQTGQTVHTVGLGETLFSIGNRYGVSAQSIAAYNGIVNLNYIYVGQALSIPGISKPSYGHQPPSKAHGGQHTVGLGETLYSIAYRYGTTVSGLMAINGISNPDYIYVGQVLSIHGHGAPPSKHYPVAQKPGCGYYYTVSYGDTLTGIAWKHGTTVYALSRANGLYSPHTVYAGQSLHIPCDAGSPKHYPKAAPKKHYAPPKAHKPKAEKKRKPKKEGYYPPACAREVQIAEPTNYKHVDGTLQIVGTANVDPFWFYKLEYAMGSQPLDSNFASIGEVRENTVNDSVLGTWYVGNMPAGLYTLRLTAVYESGNIARPCDVMLYINQ